MSQSKAGFQWTEEQVKKATEEHYYIKANQDKSKQLLITGALGRWKKDENSSDIYVSSVRLVGKAKDIEDVLLNNSYAQDRVNKILKEAYTKTNVNDNMKNTFENEVKQCREYKKKSKKDDIVNTIRVTDIVKKIPKENKVSNSIKKRNESFRNQTVLHKYNSLIEGYVMDVSTMKSDGTGIKNRKADTVKNRKGNTEKVRVVSSNFETYKEALKCLNLSTKEHDKLIKSFNNDKSGSKAEVNKKSSSSSSSSSSSTAESKKKEFDKEIPKRSTVKKEPKKKKEEKKEKPKKEPKKKKEEKKEEVKPEEKKPEPKPEPKKEEVKPEEKKPEPKPEPKKEPEKKEPEPKATNNVRNSLSRGRLRRSPNKFN